MSKPILEPTWVDENGNFTNLVITKGKDKHTHNFNVITGWKEQDDFKPLNGDSKDALYTMMTYGNKR